MLILYIGLIIIALTPILGMWHKIFPKMGRKSSEAFIPFYNYYVVLRETEQPWYWVFFMLFPGAQMVMWASLNVSLIRKFGEFGIKETIMGVLFPFPVFFNIGKDDKYKVVKPTNWDVATQVHKRTPSDHIALFFAFPIIGHVLVMPFVLLGFTPKKQGKKSMVKEWGDAILFALVAASVIRTYVFEPFQIPTGSMEKTQLVGDHLMVEKITFGPRVPNTPFSYPIFHNMIPWLNIKSYAEIQKIPYTRLPGFRFVERNDVTVFNFPAGDTSLNDPRMPHGLIGHNYHEILRDEALYIADSEGKSVGFFEKNYDYYLNKARKSFERNNKVYSRYDSETGESFTIINGILQRPVDKKENYIKRCTAIAGDEIEIKDKELFVNGELAHQPDSMLYSYQLTDREKKKFNYYNPNQPTAALRDEAKRKNDSITIELKKEIIFYKDNFNHDFERRGYNLSITKNHFSKIKTKFPGLDPAPRKKGQNKRDLDKGSLRYYPNFPNDKQYDWTEDNFGPLQIPKRGDVVELNHKTLPLYKRIIHAYEKHDLAERADGIYIDGKKVTTYTIEMNYYWLMGDNRNNSLDSRFWGFVPEDHVVGRAAFIWMSVNEKGYMGGVRWDRIFQKIK
jgi:signal peptidase I